MADSPRPCSRGRARARSRGNIGDLARGHWRYVNVPSTAGLSADHRQPRWRRAGTEARGRGCGRGGWQRLTPMEVQQGRVDRLGSHACISTRAGCRFRDRSLLPEVEGPVSGWPATLARSVLRVGGDFGEVSKGAVRCLADAATLSALSGELAGNLSSTGGGRIP